MSAFSVSGIILANSHDETLSRLTKMRSMAAVPFGARYRLIDFSLSNFVNAGITNIGIITKENYRSLMDHIGSGVYWDLDRKNGGIHIMPPFNVSKSRLYHGHLEALYGATDFLERCNSDYIVLSDAGIVANVDIAAAIESHIDNNADITVIYGDVEDFKNTTGAMTLTLGQKGNVISAAIEKNVMGKASVSIGLYIFNRELLLNEIKKQYEEAKNNLELDVIIERIKSNRVFAFKHSGYFAVMSEPKSYKAANMALLNKEVRKDLFNAKRPVFTKTRDDMPTRYGTKSSVNNCFIADGCVIDGNVKNSVIFRGVTVEQGATVENCILMQGVTVKRGATVKYVVSDKNSVIGQEMLIKGTDAKSFFVEKNQNL